MELNISDIKNNINNAITQSSVTTQLKLQEITYGTGKFGQETKVIGAEHDFNGVVVDYEKVAKRYDSYGRYNGSSFVIITDSILDFNDDSIIMIPNSDVEEPAEEGDYTKYKIINAVNTTLLQETIGHRIFVQRLVE